MNFGELLGFITAINNEVNDEPDSLELRVRQVENGIKEIKAVMASNDARRKAIAEALKGLNDRMSMIETVIDIDAENNDPKK